MDEAGVPVLLVPSHCAHSRIRATLHEEGVCEAKLLDWVRIL